MPKKLEKDSLKTEIYDNIIAYADFEKGGLYQNGELLPMTTRGVGCREPQGKDRMIDERLVRSATFEKGNFAYIGFVQLHYGHFLINTMSRIWYFLKSGGVNIGMTRYSL